MRDICLEEYNIEFITLYDGTYKNGYTENYSISEEDQKDAFEALQSICNTEHVVASLNRKPKQEERVVSTAIGPKRLEVLLRTFSGVSEKRIVLTDLMPPSGHYMHYSIAGRVWEVSTNKLKKVTETFWGSSHWIARIDAYLGGQAGSATEYFTAKEPERSWGVLEKMWIKFHNSEIEVIKNWTPDTEEEDFGYGPYGEVWTGDTHRSQHWTNRLPAAYDTKPLVASFRVAGDEVGAVIYREQQESWVKEHGNKTPAESLVQLLKEQPAEKKSAAGTEPASGSGETSQTSPSGCRDCGGPSCPANYCLDDIDLAAFGRGVVVDGGYTIH